jgi:hypothetical protein
LGVVRLIYQKTELKPKLVRRNKEVHYILIKGSIYQQSIIIITAYIPNMGALNFIKINTLGYKGRIMLQHNHGV